MSERPRTRVAEGPSLIKRLHRALENREFIVHYQPQIDLRRNVIAGFEALVRWQPAGESLIPPVQFIPAAEESGLIVPIGEWVLETATEQAKAWQKAGLPMVTIAVNLSVKQFQQKGLVDRIDHILARTGLDPACLELEITESFAMKNVEYTTTILRQLRNRAVRIAIDDFGTGYSSLSYLKDFPIDCLKIDRSFIKELAIDPNATAIADAIIVLAHNLKLEVIAEGVETAAQLDLLRRQACDKMQGYLFSPPVEASKIPAMFKQRVRM